LKREPDIRLLDIQRLERGGLALTLETTLGMLHEIDIPAEVGQAELLCLARGGKLLGGILADGFQQAIARRPGVAPVDLDQGWSTSWLRPAAASRPQTASAAASDQPALNTESRRRRPRRGSSRRS
jgi:hypothetical protein